MKENKVNPQHINTKLLHGYKVIDQHTGAASIPIYQTSTFHNHKLYSSDQEYLYTRFSNPTVDALEDGFCCLENAKYALAYSSGMAAISNALMLLRNNDHIIFPREVYGGTYQFAVNILPKYGIASSFVDMSKLEEVEQAIKPNTRMLYIETPSNPLLKITDIRATVALAKKYDLITLADNTFMTSLAQDPLALGVDIVLESVTKFINGHSDVIAGLMATNNKEFYDELKLYQKNFGGILSVGDAWLVMRGMKTMGIRMNHAVKNASLMAEFLAKHPKVMRVYYPGLEEHANFAIHSSQAKNGGAVLSFELGCRNNIMKFTQKLRIPIVAVSLGGVESIISHPATHSHACMTSQERKTQGISDGLLRLSCGIENIDDLKEDFEQALSVCH